MASNRTLSSACNTGSSTDSYQYKYRNQHNYKNIDIILYPMIKLPFHEESPLCKHDQENLHQL